MQKYFTSIFTGKKGYGLSHYKQSETRRTGKKNNIHAERSKAENFFEKI